MASGVLNLAERRKVDATFGDACSGRRYARGPSRPGRRANERADPCGDGARRRSGGLVLRGRARGIVGNKNWIDANGALARRVSFAIRAAARWANRDHADCVPLLARFTKIQPSVIASYPRIAYAESNDAGLVQPVVDVMARYGFLPHAFAASEAFAPGVE